MLVGTAGHIDHGKTTLVKALTGVDTDRLPEEKARGITLDLGYAYADEGRLGFIDVPGHERLVHNMLAGATGIDFLLLAVAADDGPMPQTREHLAIARLLGIARGAVALTKIDAVAPARIAEARDEIDALLEDSEFAASPRFAVSATSGEGVPALRRHLDEAAASCAERRADGGFRLAIDRVFTLRGVGLVVTGTAYAGRVAVGDELTLTPPGLTARVRGLHVQDRPAQAGRAGQRIAVNLAGDVAKADLARGMWLVAPALHHPVQRFQGRVRALAPLRHRQPVFLHLGAEAVIARLLLLEGETLASGGEMLAEFAAERPIAALGGDRFVLRDASAASTIGGGRVLDIFPPARHKRAPERLEALRLLELDNPAPALRHALEARAEGIELDRFAANLNLGAAENLWQALELVMVDESEGRRGFSRERWRALGEDLLAALAAEHERAPDMIGVERDRLRRLTLPALSRPAFDRLAAELLAARRLAQTGGWLHLPGHAATLAEPDAALWRLLQPLLESAPLQPPRVRDVARAGGVDEEAVRALFRRLARLGTLYPVAHDHFFTAAAVADLAGRVDELCARDGAARAAALRDTIGGGRKVAIQILEFFDRVGYTRRVRDEHARRSAAGRWMLQ